MLYNDQPSSSSSSSSSSSTTAAAIHYICNRELLEEYKRYFPTIQAAVVSGQPRPEIPAMIAHAILQISAKLSNSHNFCNYSYKNEMIGDARLKCFSKFHLFDPSKSDSPFGYLTQISYNCFINRIKSEQHQMSIRARLISDKLSTEFVANLQHEDIEVANAFVTFLRDNEIFTNYNEEKKIAPKTGYNNPLFKHRNKTPYAKTAKTAKVKESKETNLYELMSA